MPTRKQRRRSQKERRHEYETVWVDAEGNELEEPPEDAVAPPEKHTNGSKPKAKTTPQRGGRPARVPQAPSWRRAAKRSLLLGVGIFVVVYISNASHGNRTITAFGFAALYTLLFIPLTFTMDRWSYNRFQRRAAEQGQKPRKR
ncbi:MAG TPA: hypothetical protein VKO84_01665 [Gaiellaceae bacterium]|nr:hypothetical protein [Gaiellaceae bacterium]